MCSSESQRVEKALHKPQPGLALTLNRLPEHRQFVCRSYALPPTAHVLEQGGGVGGVGVDGGWGAMVCSSSSARARGCRGFEVCGLKRRTVDDAAPLPSPPLHMPALILTPVLARAFALARARALVLAPALCDAAPPLPSCRRTRAGRYEDRIKATGVYIRGVVVQLHALAEWANWQQPTPTVVVPTAWRRRVSDF
ncbi:hypothetical protein T492DRAFT_1014382 [Pavlovales sp. CCMP2436]|nr:hypothetical protein T492DRAFT_1014382 [Pavlovales sp. CCMP2436]